MGVAAMTRLLNDKNLKQLPFAAPFLRTGKLLIAQSANILQYLGPRHGLAPKSEAGRLWSHQLQLTLADFVDEIHDTHHPIANSLYYHEQMPEAQRRTKYFLAERTAKYLGYFEGILKSNGSSYSVGRSLTYVDLSLFQIVAGLRYAFPKTSVKSARKYPLLMALHDRVAQRPSIAAYLESPRRIPFNQNGIFRYYPELEG
jgi:glutathione S-transferase